MTNLFFAQPGTIPARVIDWLHEEGRGGEWATAVLAEALAVDGRTLVASMKPAIVAGAVSVRCREHLNYWRLGTGQPSAPRPPDNEPDEPDEPGDHPQQSVVKANGSHPPVTIPPGLNWHAQAPAAPAEASPEAVARETLERIGFPVPDGKHTFYRSLVLRVRGGQSSFVLRYTWGDRRREMGLGIFVASTRDAAIDSISRAIVRADAALAQLADGIDPLQGREEADEQQDQVAAAGPLRAALWSDGQLAIEAQGVKLVLGADDTRKLFKYLAGLIEAALELEGVA